MALIMNVLIRLSVVPNMPILREKKPLIIWCRLFHRCVLAYRYAPVWHFGHFSSLVYSAILFFVSLPFKKNYYHDNQQTNKKRFEQKWKIDPEKNKINPFLSKENP
jgi:hypothetical protein